MTTSFAVTWDYRCPFARNAHDHLVAALQGGSDWQVTFVPFSLDQAHIEEGQPPVFDSPEEYPGLLGNLVGIVVRDRFPDKFLAAHKALFDARHRDAADLRQREVIAPVLESVGLDPAAVFAEVDDGWPIETHRKEHLDIVASHDVFGVPTFIVGDQAVFVRLMDRAEGDAARGTQTISRVLDLLTGWPALNEFKHTSIPR
jgi:protein-disulfide isomerase-like protein with CxxC motif